MTDGYITLNGISDSEFAEIMKLKKQHEGYLFVYTSETRTEPRIVVIRWTNLMGFNSLPDFLETEFVNEPGHPPPGPAVLPPIQFPTNLVSVP